MPSVLRFLQMNAWLFHFWVVSLSLSSRAVERLLVVGHTKP
jgi:hypothetical protein